MEVLRLRINIRALVRQITNTFALLTLVATTIIGGCTDLQGIRQRAEHAVQQSVPVRVIGENGYARHYNVKLAFFPGRKGPDATLEIYHYSSATDVLSTKPEDSYTTPVEIKLGNNIRDLNIPRAQDGSVRQITVALHEIQFDKAYLDPIELDYSLLNFWRNDTNDFVTEFIIHQPDTINNRVRAIPRGTYMLDYKAATDTWVLSRLTGLTPLLRFPKYRHNVQLAVLILAIVLNAFIGFRSYKEVAEGLLVIVVIGTTMALLWMFGFNQYLFHIVTLALVPYVLYYIIRDKIKTQGSS